MQVFVLIRDPGYPGKINGGKSLKTDVGHIIKGTSVTKKCPIARVETKHDILMFKKL